MTNTVLFISRNLIPYNYKDLDCSDLPSAKRNEFCRYNFKRIIIKYSLTTQWWNIEGYYS